MDGMLARAKQLLHVLQPGCNDRDTADNICFCGQSVGYSVYTAKVIYMYIYFVVLLACVCFNCLLFASDFDRFDLSCNLIW